MIISCIVAGDIHGGIGLKGKLPWRIPSELQYFKETTMGHPVIMGRKTYESFSGPLPNRLNIVLSSHPKKGDVTEVTSVLEALIAAQVYYENIGTPPEDREVFVIGGAQVYKAFEPYFDKVYLTVVYSNYEVDTYFDSDFIDGADIPQDTWYRHTAKTVAAEDDHPAYTCYVYERTQQKFIF